jgi:peroxiredoxin
MADIQEGQAAPEFGLSALDGSRINSLSFKGKAVLLNFFKSNCPWCQQEMPRLAHVYERVKEQGLHVPIVGIVVGEDTLESAQTFAQSSGLNIPLAIDSDNKLRQEFGITRVPTLVLLDAQGLVARIYEGASEQLTGIVEQALIAADRGNAAPTFEMVGNGCSVD